MPKQVKSPQLRKDIIMQKIEKEHLWVAIEMSLLIAMKCIMIKINSNHMDRPQALGSKSNSPPKISRFHAQNAQVTHQKIPPLVVYQLEQSLSWQLSRAYLLWGTAGPGARGQPILVIPDRCCQGKHPHQNTMSIFIYT